MSLNPTDAPVLLHDIFDRIATRFPECVAIEVPPTPVRPERIQVTYSGLRRHAEALASALRPHVQPDAIVAILLSRDSPDLYVAQLAVLKSGAAFTCIDPQFPDEQIRLIVGDGGAAALITNAAGRKRVTGFGATTPPILAPDSAISSAGSPRMPAPENLAYVIYTSGTTGKPKGVMIEHRSIVNLVAANVARFGLACNDRVAQCSSPAYDSSIEEAWLAFAVGATLVLLDEPALRLGPDLPPWLRRERITVFCPPPTLLRSTGCNDPQVALPELKLLYVGGEALPADLADRWSAGRWMENGYGPTECTVTVVRGRVQAGRAVTIGTPVPGCRAWILDELLREVPDGESGELCISGVALARGYKGLDDLTREKFPTHAQFGRIYRTGDIAQCNPNGEIEYLGRLDAQVKLRGYRIELAAIETKLAECAGVRAAACTLQTESGAPALAAHIVPALLGEPPSITMLKEALRRALPEYMVPSRFSFLERLPTTAGGKLDRKSLPDIAASSPEVGRPIVAPRTENENLIATAFQRALKLTNDISVHDDFFTNLGGDSLSVVAVVLELRGANGTSWNATTRDIYEARTVARLAELRSRDSSRGSAPLPFRERSAARGHPMLSTAIQCVWIGFLLVISGAFAYATTFGLLPFLMLRLSLVQVAIALPFLSVFGLLVYAPVSVAIVMLLKWVLIGRYRPICTPVWGNFYTRHWIVTSAARFIPWALVQGTIFESTVLRALGAKIGQRVHFHRGVDVTRGGWDLLTIGDDVTLSQDAAVRLVELDDRQLVVGPITLGDGATLDTRAGMSPGSTLEKNAYLTPLSWLPSGKVVPMGEQWNGVPAAPAGYAPPRQPITRGVELTPHLHATLVLLGRFTGMLVAAAPLLVMAIFAEWFVSDADARAKAWLDSPELSIRGLSITFALAAASIAVTVILQGLTMRAMGRIQSGVVSHWSLEGIRIWNKTGMVDSAGRWLAGTVFWPFWLRLAGMGVGRGCEISTIIDVLPETLTIGPSSFFADGIYLCAPWRHRGTITISTTELGRGTFLGNHAVIPAGNRWPEGLFVGVATLPDAARSRPNSAWFGHPPMELPRREVIAADPRLTHKPPPLRYATRLFWELMRLALPALPILVGCEWYALMSAAAARFGIAEMALMIAPLLAAATMISMCMAVVLVKWLLLGRTRPGQRAFWSCWCGRWDFLYMAWENWARAWLTALEGTLLLNAFLRLTGVRIGRRVILGHGFTQVVDPDMLFIEDDATVMAHFQTHSFEDRVLKIDHVQVGRGATIGENAVVFYGADIRQNAHVAPHSVVMKHDILAADTAYAGCPTSPAVDS